MENIVNLTKNEQKVLKYLAENSKMTDSEIANKMNLTVSSVSRIREKLFEKKIIEGYTTKIDYDLLGIKCYVLVFYSATPLWWEKIGENMKKIVNNSPQIVCTIRTNERDLSYVMIYGFPNNKIANRYLNEIQNTYNNYLTIEKAIFLSRENFIKNDFSSLLKVAFDTDPETINPDKPFFNKLLKKE